MKWWFLIMCMAPQDFCTGFGHVITSTEFYAAKAECVAYGSLTTQKLANIISLPVLWGMWCFENSINPKPDDRPLEGKET